MRAEPPLDPTPEQARRLFREELLGPDYTAGDPTERLMDWLNRLLETGVRAAGAISWVSALLGMIVLALVLLGLVVLLSRGRRTATTARTAGPVLTREVVTAAELRDRADRALQEGRPAAAVVDGFRALTRRQVELGLLPDEPGATAHEVASALGGAHPTLRGEIDDCAGVFDLVRYGDREAAPDQARRVLALDDRLTGALR